MILSTSEHSTAQHSTTQHRTAHSFAQADVSSAGLTPEGQHVPPMADTAQHDTKPSAQHSTP